MVEIGKGPYKEGIDNSVFIIPGIVVVSLFIFFVYKLVKNLRDKKSAQEEKKKAKQMKKEKEAAKKNQPKKKL